MTYAYVVYVMLRALRGWSQRRVRRLDAEFAESDRTVHNAPGEGRRSRQDKRPVSPPGGKGSAGSNWNPKRPRGAGGGGGGGAIGSQPKKWG